MLKHDWKFYHANSVVTRLLSKQLCKSRWYFYVCNRSQMITSWVKNKKSTTREEVEWRHCCSLHAVTRLRWSFTVHTRKMLSICFIQWKLKWIIKGFGGTKKEKRVRWRDLSRRICRHLCTCVCPLTDHDHNPWKWTQQSHYCIILDIL